MFSAGDHVPVILFVEVVGNAANVAPLQIAATCVNAGVIIGFTVMVIVAVVAQRLSTAEGSSTSNLPLAKGKGWIYEGGIRVPFIIKAPNSKKARVLSRRFFS